MHPVDKSSTKARDDLEWSLKGDGYDEARRIVILLLESLTVTVTDCRRWIEIETKQYNDDDDVDEADWENSQMLLLLLLLLLMK